MQGSLNGPLLEITSNYWLFLGPPLPVAVSRGSTLGPNDGLDTVYRLSRNYVLRLREDFSGWDNYTEWEVGDGATSFPFIYTA